MLYILKDPKTGKMNQSLVDVDIAIQQELQNFLNKYDSIEIIADWPDDIKYFCELMITAPGYMISTIPKMTFTLDRTLNGVSEFPHHAYYDALANMELTLTKELGV